MSENEPQQGDAGADDDETAGAVDERAGQLTGAGAADDGPRDPAIADAEAHIASLDMDEERRKVKELTDDL